MPRASPTSDISMGKSSAEINEAVTSGRADFNTHFAPQWVSVIDSRRTGHGVGRCACRLFELFGKQDIRSIGDLKGKSVGVAALGSSDHIFVSVMAAHVGLDPHQGYPLDHQSDLRQPAELFVDGKIDAFLALPPEPQELRARGTSVTSSSTAPSTARGRNISAVCWRATVNSSGNIRSRPSACCAPFSRLRSLRQPSGASRARARR